MHLDGLQRLQLGRPTHSPVPGWDLELMCCLPPSELSLSQQFRDAELYSI
jgi:hypothetical protein